jgi:hypothetical protein
MVAVFQRMYMLRVVLAAALLAEGLPAALWAGQDDITSVENVRFEIAGDLVRIYYDLNAPIDKVHAVRLMLRRESDIVFLYHPLNVTGDVGTIVFPGQRRRIVWDFTKEFPNGLSGNDYYFIVEAEYIEPERMSPWIWIGGGAAVVGGVVGIILLTGKSEPVPPTPVPTGFPQPPSRPN